MLIRLSDYSQYSFGNFSPGSLIIALVIVGVLNNSHVLLTKSIKEIGPCKRQPYVDTSAVEILYGGQFTLSLQLIKPNYL